ncbi:MAG: HAD family hydrolase [bacterium]|nr:HAD family hydrolase [bacterium]MCM1374826.1 HAD family hydrolase [Muribaculum sp.]
MYDHYIFDLYGTLVDIRTNESKASLWRKMSELYTAMGARYDSAGLRREFRRLERENTQKVQIQLEDSGCGDILAEPDLTDVFQQLYQARGAACERQQAQMTAIFFRTLSRQYLRSYDKVKETLNELRSRGKGVYLLSNAQSDFTRPELELLGLTDCFDGIVISSEEGCKKPCAAFFNRLLERYRLYPHSCLMVGNDEYADIGGAAGVGMDSLYLHTATSPQPQGRYRPTYCVMDGQWSEVADILLGRGEWSET